MQELVISVQGLAGEAAGGQLRARFDEHGGSIGRADDNTLVLPDPRRHISRHQADIVFEGGVFQIVNAAQSNPITLNRAVVEPGGARPLRGGDELLIGGYVLRVEGGVASPPPADPFDDLLAPGPTAATPAAALRPASPSSSRSPLPDDFDPFAVTGIGGAPATASRIGAGARAGVASGADWGGAPRGPSAAPTPAASADPAAMGGPAARPAPWGSPLSDIPDAGAGTSLDKIFGLDRGASTAWDDLLAPAPSSAGAGRPRTPATSSGSDLDPLARFASPPAPAVPLPTQAAWDDHTPEIHAPFMPPPIRPPAAPPPGPAPAPMPAVGGPMTPGGPALLWRAFEEGAGLPPSGEALDEAVLAERMRLLGALMLAGLDGTLRLMAARASTKQELRAEVTVIQPSGNNPLKFTRDAHAALRSLVQPAARGFMPAVPAWTDAMDDLLGHAVGTMAGMRAALDGLLAHFEPEKLEAALATPSLLESLLPAHRQAHLWKAYLERYRQVQTAAAEDFHGAFGRSFVQAYEAQLQRLDQARAAASAPAAGGTVR